jgi:hypothetical protein
MATQPSHESRYYLGYNQAMVEGVPGFVLMVQPPFTNGQADILETKLGVDVERIDGNDLHTNIFVSNGAVVGINHQKNTWGGLEIVLDSVADLLVENS